MDKENDQIEFILKGNASDQEKVDELNSFAYANRNTIPKTSLKAAGEALELAQHIGYKKGRANSLLNRGFCRMHGANHEKAFADLIESLAIYAELGDEKGVADAEYNIGVVHLRIGNFDSAVESLHKSLAYREKQNDLSGIAACHFQLSYINQSHDDQDGAFIAANKSLELRRALG